MNVLISTSPFAPSLAARSTATAPPSDSPITTMSFSAIFSRLASHARAARASDRMPASLGLPSLRP